MMAWMIALPLDCIFKSYRLTDDKYEFHDLVNDTNENLPFLFYKSLSSIADIDGIDGPIKD